MLLSPTEKMQALCQQLVAAEGFELDWAELRDPELFSCRWSVPGAPDVLFQVRFSAEG